MDGAPGFAGDPRTNSSELDRWSLPLADRGGNSSSTRGPFYNRQVRIISMSVIFAVAFLGNSIVLHKICCGRSKRRKIDALITNLAVADLCVSVLTLLSQIVWEVLEDRWVAGDLACRLFKVLQVFGLIASSNIIAIIALERHHVIVRPLASPLPTKLLATVGWLAALVLALPQAFVFKVQPDRSPHSKCLNTFSDLPRWHFQAYIVYGSVTVFFAPFCVLCVAYARILWTVWSRDTRASGTAHGLLSRKPRHRKRPLRVTAANSAIPRAKIKTLKMTLVIIILFIVCGLPYFVVEMKSAFGATTDLDEEVIAVLGIFVVTNSAVNPYVYLFFKTNNVYLRKMEKKMCFSCLQDYKESTLHRELLVYHGRKTEPSTHTSLDTDPTAAQSVSLLKPAASLGEITSAL
ncbi:probable G-protein coupled receptor 150 [Lepisosteus oculatus]|uniref:probable G-protein coupled receptor 150 n=1 Tax=Lepisosteus oculatus TaxID=7918 RepID=UPI00371C5D6F